MRKNKPIRIDRAKPMVLKNLTIINYSIADLTPHHNLVGGLTLRYNLVKGLIFFGK